MTLQERLRELIPNGYGYNSEFAHTMRDAADRIDELEKQLSEAVIRIPARHTPIAASV